MGGSFEDMLPRLRAAGGASGEIIDELEDIYRALSEVGAAKHLRIDLSVVNDMNYYNGVVFSGYVRGVPFRVLSGGRYDRLLDRLGKSGSAIGFAVYLGKLERYIPKRHGDADILLTYDADSSPEQVMRAMRELSSGGAPVLVLRDGESCPEGIRTRYHIGKDGVITNA